MGRPREHDERTAAALLDSAERLIETGGPEALSLRQIAHRARTTTRAVYGLFGSKEGLIGALGNRAFEILGAGIRALPITKYPVADLFDAGVLVFRGFALAPFAVQNRNRRTLEKPGRTVSSNKTGSTRFAPAAGGPP